MIATKTATLMVAMAVMGIVPVAAHAQSVDIAELVEQSGTAEQISAPDQRQGQANLDEDRNSQPTFIFATVGPFGTLTSTNTNTIDDADTLTNTQEQVQEAPLVQIPTQTQTPTQMPTLSVGNLMGILPTD
jgi:hypothetical protein